MRAALAAFGLLGLAACTPGACDPSQAGFLSGIGCEASGSYGARNAYQQSQLASTNAEALENRAAALNQRDRANDALLSRDQARARLAGVDRQTAQLRSRLAAAQNRAGVDQVRLAQLQGEVSTLQAQRGALDAGSATPAALRDIEDRQRRMMREISGL